MKPTKIDINKSPKFTGKDKTANTKGFDTPSKATNPMPRIVFDEKSEAFLQIMLQKNVEYARADANAFIEFVMVTPDQKPIKQADMHIEWQKIFAKEKYINLWSHVEAGKSTQVTGYLLYRLGLNPNLRILYISKNEDLSKKACAELQRYIQAEDEVGQRLHLVFPHLRPGAAKQDLWMATKFNILRDNPYMRDPTFQAFGLGGNPTGSRADIVILDDLLTTDSTASPTERDKTWDFIQNKVLSRLTENAQVISIGTPFHPDDLMHRMEAQPHWYTRKFPIINRFTWDEATLSWPEVWSMKRLLEKKATLAPADFARQMLCEARDDSASLFTEADIRVALELGYDYEPVFEVYPWQLEPGEFIYTGVDLGIKKGAGRDFTVLFTVLCKANKQRQVLWVDIGQYGPREIVNKINETYRRYRGIIYVENNQGQDYIVQWMEDEEAKDAVRPFTTGSNKNHPDFGVESISVELSKGMWIIPSKVNPLDNPFSVTSGHKDIDTWISNMLFYRRGAHVGDALMASWIAREGARYGEYVQSASLSASLISSDPYRSMQPKIPSMFTRHTING